MTERDYSINPGRKYPAPLSQRSPKLNQMGAFKKPPSDLAFLEFSIIG
jgi:hypothetical protein